MAENVRSVAIGEMVVSGNNNDVLVAYGLGSCVAVCLYDPVARVGGMSHALLPSSQEKNGGGSNPIKYVDQGTPRLIDELLKAGGRRSRLKVSLCGGGQVLSAPGFDGRLNIGERNVLAAEAALKKTGLRVQAQSTGGRAGRTVKLYIADGQVVVKTLGKGLHTLQPGIGHQSRFPKRSENIGERSTHLAAKLTVEKEKHMSTVMVVDDNQFMRKRISKVLTENGYETVMAEDGEQAVQVYRSVRPDATLLDVTMPKKDGIEALTEIRQLDPAAKVIMLTALNQQSVMVQAVQLGAKDFLTKPVVPERLMAALQKVLR